MTPPSARALANALKVLHRTGALEARTEALTPLGCHLADLPMGKPSTSHAWLRPSGRVCCSNVDLALVITHIAVFIRTHRARTCTLVAVHLPHVAIASLVLHG